MRRYLFAALSFITLIALPVEAQKTTVEPISIAAGTILAFHLHTRLNPATENELDLLPKGTLIRVKTSSAVDSTVDRDGSEFRGQLVSPIVSRKEVIVHSDSEVRGLLVLLRSRNHPEGFRYELLVTQITDNGKSFDLTASLHPSLLDAETSHTTLPEPEPAKSPDPVTPPTGKVPASN